MNHKVNKDKLKKVITLDSEGLFEVELTGLQQARTAVIFVHGFGVKRQSRGLFLDIESLLPDNILSVRAEFSKVLDDRCIALPFPIQHQRLHKIIDYVRQHYLIDHFIYIGHSQGCITIALEKPQNSFILLLAPPIISPFEKFLKTKGWGNPGSRLTIQGTSHLVRSDLIIEIPPEFWVTFKEINAQLLYKKLAEHNDVNIIIAENDQVLGKQPLIRTIPTNTIADADHDFSAMSRRQLLNLITIKLQCEH